MHTRTDLNLEKQWGNPSGPNFTLALEAFNLFNQKDVRSAPPGPGREVDFAHERWQQWGIAGLERASTSLGDGGEIFDINNYWDAPREITFSIRLKW